MSQILVTITDDTGVSRVIRVTNSSAVIGRGRSCDVSLDGWLVGKSHARVVRTAKGLMLEDLGQMTGTWVNGNRIVRHEPLEFADEIRIASYQIRVKEESNEVADPEALDGQGTHQKQAEPFLCGLGTPPSADTPPIKRGDAGTGETAAQTVRLRFQWRRLVHEQLLRTIDLRRRDLTRMSDEEVRTETETLVREIVASLQDLPAFVDREALTREVLNEAVGLGPLEELLADESVSEIMINRADEIFIERGGRLHPYPIAFTSDRAVLGVIERIVAPLGRRIDESSPMVDARLKDGSRVNAVIPPLAIKGPTVTIRKFPKHRLTVEDMVRLGTLSPQMTAFLKTCVTCRKNIAVSGGTGSGKTTFLNLLSDFIPDGERVITIEDSAELRLHHSHLISLEARPPNAEGRGAVSIRDLVRNALRMRPDRIVVGECRSGEALDMLQAMNTGHEGSLTTLHANSPRDGLARLETMVLMAGMDLPLTAIREQIASAIDIVVQQTRFACGARKVTSITEVTGMENGKIQIQELFRFQHRGYGPEGTVTGSYEPCDIVPTFFEDLRAQGLQLDLEIFKRGSS